MMAEGVKLHDNCKRTRRKPREIRDCAQVAPRIDGVVSGKFIEVRYALALRAEYTSVGTTSEPYRDLFFKMFSRGTCNMTGGNIGFSVSSLPRFAEFDRPVLASRSKLGSPNDCCATVRPLLILHSAPHVTFRSARGGNLWATFG